MSRLITLYEISHRGRSGVQSRLHFVQRRPERRSVADQYQRMQRGERRQIAGDLRFGVLSRRIEGRRAGVAETRDLPVADEEMLPVQAVETILLAQGGNLSGRFVIAGQ